MKVLLRRLLVVVGITLLAAGAVVRWAGPGWWEHGPLHTDAVLNATGSGTFLNLQAASPAPAPTNFEVTQKQVTACQGLKISAEKLAGCPAGHPRLGTSSIAVWDQLQTTCAVQVNPCPAAATISTANERVAFDRDNGGAVGGYGETPAHLVGGLEFKFPFHTDKKTYSLWDPTALRVFPATFDGAATDHGVAVYRFKSVVKDANLGAFPQPLPAVLFGGAPSAAPVEAHQHYTSTTVLDVEPTTGTPIDSTQSLEITLQPVTGGTTGLPLITITNLKATAATVDELARQALHDRRDVRLLETTTPLVLEILGAAALIAGLGLTIRAGRTPRP